MAGLPEADVLLAEQRAYYRHIAPTYERYALPGLAGATELVAAFEEFDARGEVLELACGTGLWTERLVRRAKQVTAVDASSEMLEIAQRRVGEAGARARFVQADIFDWLPEPRHAYDAVVFGFWLSHVPMERFARFWALVAECLADGGRVFFADDAHRGPDELVYGPASEVVQRRLADGSVHRVVKVPHTARSLQERLSALGWAIQVHATEGPFYWGAGGRG